jgi:hypothetical protein
LCAAGRYWCHDAKYRKHIGDRERLKTQLLQVAEQAETDDYKMGERYDMNYVYYKSNKNWHGSPLYYEYPNTFAAVLFRDYLGFSGSDVADISLMPALLDFGSVKSEVWGVSYKYEKNNFTVTNLTNEAKTAELDLSLLYKGSAPCILELLAGQSKVLKV